MTNFVYRLQTLLEQKIGRKQSAQQALAERRRELAAEEEALEQCVQDRRTADERLARGRSEMFGGGQPVAGNAIPMRRDYVRRLEVEAAGAADAALLQESRVQDARERVTSAQQALTEASLKVEILERHKQRLLTRFQREEERKEAVEHDEAGNMVYLRRRRQA